MSNRVLTTADGCRLAYDDVGEELPVLWQHGLGADRRQPAEVFPHQSGLRRITLECRGHGGSDLGDPARLTIPQFAEDALALLDHLGIDKALIGGISLGAAIALRLAAKHTGRVRGLILARPAWIGGAGPDPLRVYRDVADLMDAYGAAEGGRRFEASARFAEVRAVSSDNAASLRGFFDRARPDTTVALLSRIPAGGPDLARADIAALAVPTLVIANGQDYVHPLGLARALAGLIPGAQFTEITSKTVSRERYVGEFRAALEDFLAALPAAA